MRAILSLSTGSRLTSVTAGKDEEKERRRDRDETSVTHIDDLSFRRAH